MKLKRIFSFMTAVALLLTTLTFPSQAASKPEWVYKFTLWVADVNDAGAPESSVYGYLVFRDDSKREQSFANAGIKRGATVTKEITTGYAPWTVKTVGITNKSDNALCVAGIKLEVKEKGASKYITLLDKYNPKSDNKKWIETQKGSGYDKCFEKSISSETKRDISAIGNFKDNFSGEYTLDVTKTYSDKVTKTWNKQITDQYLAKYNSKDYSDAPTISYDFSGTALDADVTVNRKLLEKNGFSESDGGDGYALDMAKIMSFMNEKTINKLTITATLQIPFSSLDTGCLAYKNLGGKDKGKFTSVYTITRNAFAVSDITYTDAVTNSENISDNFYYSNSNPTVKVSAKVKIGGNNNHISLADIKGKNINFKSAQIQLGSDETALVSAKNTTVVISNDGVFTLEFPIDSGHDSENVGLTLILKGAKIDAKNGLWLCEEKVPFIPGGLSVFASEYKVDTIKPFITLAAADGGAENGWRKSITLTSDASENIYSNSGANTYEYEFKSENNALSISDKNGTDNYNILQTAPAARGYATAVTVALRNKLEAIGSLVIHGKDIAGNPLETLYNDIRLDNLSPRANMQVKEKARAADGSKSTEYLFDIEDASGTGKVYYCFTEGLSDAPELNKNNLQKNSGTLDTTVGIWAYIEQGTKAVALLKCESGKSFIGRLHYFTKDAFDNTSEMQKQAVTLLNENTSCDITAANENTKIPLKDYNINITTEQGNEIFWRWSHPHNDGYVADFIKYSADIGKGKQIDGSGNEVVLDGQCTLEVKIVTPSGIENTVSRQFVFDNSVPEIDFTAKSAGTFREIQTIEVKAIDASQITAASAVVLNADGSEIEDMQEIPINIADGIAAQNISPTGLKSGTYKLKVSAVDSNGYEAKETSNPFYIRCGAPTLTLAIPSEKTFNGAPLLSNENYILNLSVNEAFAGPTENISQTLYYRIADGNGEYGAWINAGTMRITDSGYSFKTDVDSPVTLSEGENKISVQTVIAAGNANPDYLGADIAATEAITVYYDETPPQYWLRLNDSHTSGSIFGTLALSDNLSGKIFLTSSDEKVKLTETADENTFAIEVTGNTETDLTAIDVAGNKTKIPVKITMIDKKVPTVEIDDVSELQKGMRTDVSAKVSISGADKDTVQFALLPASEALGKSIQEKYFSYSEDAFCYELLSEKNSAYIGETDCVYSVSLAGVTGEYVIGVRCADSVGNTVDKIFADKTLRPVNAEIFTNGFDVLPKKAGERAVVTVDFNVPVSVLPQNMITDTPAEDSTIDETNLELAGNYIEGFSQKASFVIETIGTYKLYAVDELGRGKVIDINITDEDISFGNTAQLNINTVLVKKYFDYTLGKEVVLEKTPLEKGKWASSEKLYIADSTNGAELVTRVEITAKDSDVFLRDINYTENDGLTFNEDATILANAPGADFYTTLVYDVSQIIDENTQKAIDKNERIIEVYAYHPENDFETWQKTQVIVDTIDNTPPNGEITIEPSVLRDEATGEPQSFTLGNVKAQATFSDPHSGIDSICIDIWKGEDFDFYEIPLTEDYTTEPYSFQNESFSIKVWSNTDSKTTKYIELEFYKNVGASLSARNTAGDFGYCGPADGLNIDYINKTDISNSDYTLSYYYMDNNGEWQPIADENIYYKNAKAVVLPSESGTERGLYIANNGGSFEKTLNSLERSFDFILRDKYGYEKTVSAELSHFDTTPGTITYSLSSVGKTNQPVPITITVLDDESGVGLVTLTHGTEKIPLTDNGDGSFSGKVSNAGNHVITLFDKARNKTQKSFMVSNIDSALPLITGKEYSTEDRTSKSVSVKLKFSKPNVRLTKIETDGILKESDYNVDYINSTLRFSENGTLSVWFTDDYGNVGSDTVAVGNIYKTPPSVEAVMEVADDKLSVNVSFRKAVDGTGAPIDMRELTELTVVYGGIANRIENENGEKAVYTFSQNGIYTFKVYDDDGLATYVTLEIKDIDTSAPKITQIRWSYAYDILENGEWKRKAESGYRDVGEESGYIMATDIYPLTNQNVSITAVTDSETAVIGADEILSKEHTLPYTQNGMYIFNLKKRNGLSDSYGVDVELIDKTPPVIEVSSPEIVFYENPEANEVPYSKALLESFKAYDMFGGYNDLSERVTIDYGTFNADDISANNFDRTAPYTVTYHVSDNTGNSTEFKRTVRLVGYFDTIALVNGTLPNYAGRKEIDTDTIKISLENFSGISYARIEKGVKTLGQMKKIGKVIPEKTLGSSEYEYTVAENGWYTVMVQTDKRDYFNLQIYVQK